MGVPPSKIRGNPSQIWTGVPYSADGGTPIQGQDRGVPLCTLPSETGWGTPTPSKTGWGTPCSRLDGVLGIPTQDQDRGYPYVPSHLRLDGVPPHPRLDEVPPVQDWMGYWVPPPHLRLDGVPPPIPRLDVVPRHPPSAKRALATRLAVCLLRSRRRTFL